MASWARRRPSSVRLKLVADAADEVAAEHLDGLFVLEEAQRLLDHLERQAEQPGQVQAEQAAARVQGAEDHVVEEAGRQAGLLQVLRGAGGLGQRRRRPSPRLFLICCIAAHLHRRCRAGIRSGERSSQSGRNRDFADATEPDAASDGVRRRPARTVGLVKAARSRAPRRAHEDEQRQAEDDEAEHDDVAARADVGEVAEPEPPGPLRPARATVRRRPRWRGRRLPRQHEPGSASRRVDRPGRAIRRSERRAE